MMSERYLVPGETIAESITTKDNGLGIRKLKTNTIRNWNPNDSNSFAGSLLNRYKDKSQLWPIAINSTVN